MFNFTFFHKSIHISGNLNTPQQCQGVQRADAVISPIGDLSYVSFPIDKATAVVSQCESDSAETSHWH